MKQFLGIDHPAVAAESVDGLAAWYCDVLGYEKHTRTDQPVWILEAPDGTLLEVMPKDASPRPERGVCTPGWSHLALRVSDFDAAHRALDAQGVRWMGEEVEAAAGGRLRSFADPDGNMLQIVQR